MCRRLLVTLWAGSLWSIGFLAAPLLFSALPNHALAGIAARQLFVGVEYLGLICGLSLMIVMRVESAGWLREAAARPVALMLILSVVSLLAIDPWLDRMRLAYGPASPAFLWAHSLASLVYLALCGLAVWLTLSGETATPKAT